MVRFSERDYEALDDKRHSLRTSFQQIGSDLFLRWLAEDSDAEPEKVRAFQKGRPGVLNSQAREPKARWYAMLDDILASGNPPAIQTALLMLNACHAWLDQGGRGRRNPVPTPEQLGHFLERASELIREGIFVKPEGEASQERNRGRGRREPR